jgi:hypothetical protein
MIFVSEINLLKSVLLLDKEKTEEAEEYRQ